VRRAVGFVVHNWPLKLAAVVLATLLYAGLVLSQNAQAWRGRVPIIPLRQPASAVLLTTLPDVTSIRYFAPPDAASRLSSSSFTATVDLSDVVVNPEAPFVTAKVEVTATDPRVQILDFEPQAIRVQLDPLVSKEVPVEVDRGPVPAGLEVREPVVSSSSVTVSGPESVIKLVTAAQARVVIQPSGIDVDQEVDLIAIDARGQVLAPVDIEPSSVRVKIRVGSQLESKTLPVDPVVIGTQAAGYEIAGIEVTPPVISVEGEADALADLVAIDTSPVSISGAVEDVARTVDLMLPDGVASLGPSSARVVVRIQPTTGTRSLSAGVLLSGARADRTYELSTDRVVLTVGGTTADLDALNGRTLTAIADVGDLGPGAHDVPLRVVLPSGVGLVAINPPRIVVTVGLPSTPQPSPSPSASPSPSPAL
jgi:YbbR domain-containing protein